MSDNIPENIPEQIPESSPEAIPEAAPLPSSEIVPADVSAQLQPEVPVEAAGIDPDRGSSSARSVFIAIAGWIIPGLGHLVQRRVGRAMAGIIAVGTMAMNAPACTASRTSIQVRSSMKGLRGAGSAALSARSSSEASAGDTPSGATTVRAAARG